MDNLGDSGDALVEGGSWLKAPPQLSCLGSPTARRISPTLGLHRRGLGLRGLWLCSLWPVPREGLPRGETTGGHCTPTPLHQGLACPMAPGEAWGPLAVTSVLSVCLGQVPSGPGGPGCPSRPHSAPWGSCWGLLGAHPLLRIL